MVIFFFWKICTSNILGGIREEFRYSVFRSPYTYYKTIIYTFYVWTYSFSQIYCSMLTDGGYRSEAPFPLLFPRLWSVTKWIQNNKGCHILPYSVRGFERVFVGRLWSSFVGRSIVKIWITRSKQLMNTIRHFSLIVNCNQLFRILDSTIVLEFLYLNEFNSQIFISSHHK